MRKKKRKPKEPLNTLDKYIIFCLIFISLYTIVHTVIFALTGKEAKVLDALVFTGYFGEVVQCYFIKKGKLHEEAKIIFGKKKKQEEFEDTDIEDYEDNMGDIE